MARKFKIVEDPEAIFEAEKEAEFDSTSAYLEKVKRINREKARLRRVFKDIPVDKKNLVQSTMADVAFMTITMEDLRENIIRQGTTVEYKNGEHQFGEKQSPDAQLYLQFSQKQTQAMKILFDCLPKTLPPPPELKDKDQEMDLDAFARRK